MFSDIDGLALNESRITQTEGVQQLFHILLLITGERPFLAGAGLVSYLLLLLMETVAF